MRGPIFRGIQCDSQKASEPRTGQKDETEINRITGEDPGKDGPPSGKLSVGSVSLLNRGRPEDCKWVRRGK